MDKTDYILGSEYKAIMLRKISIWETQIFLLLLKWAFLVAQMVKNPSAMWKTWVLSLGWEDPLEESMATHSSILAWRIPTDRGTWWASPQGCKEWDMTERLSTHYENNPLMPELPSRITPGLVNLTN